MKIWYFEGYFCKIVTENWTNEQELLPIQSVILYYFSPHYFLVGNNIWNSLKFGEISFESVKLGNALDLSTSLSLCCYL